MTEREQQNLLELIAHAVRYIRNGQTVRAKYATQTVLQQLDRMEVQQIADRAAATARMLRDDPDLDHKDRDTVYA